MRSTVTRYLFALVTMTDIFTNSGTTIKVDEIIFISLLKSVHKNTEKKPTEKGENVVSFHFRS